MSKDVVTLRSKGRYEPDKGSMQVVVQNETDYTDSEDSKDFTTSCKLSMKVIMVVVILVLIVLVWIVAFTYSVSYSFRVEDAWERRWAAFPAGEKTWSPEIFGDMTYTKPDKNTDYLITTKFLHNHMDIRWGSKAIADNQTAITEHLRDTFQAWTRFCDKNDLHSWIAHGTLIGWSWNQQLLPWDVDIDAQVTTHDLLTKMKKLNFTDFEGRFFFDVNRHVPHRLPQIGNQIDARFIDKKSGLYVDITGLSFSNQTGKLQCKSPHHYKISQIFPLRRVTFEGVETWRPNEVTSILFTEYGHKVALPQINIGPQTWRFSASNNKWTKSGRPRPSPKPPVPKQKKPS